MPKKYINILIIIFSVVSFILLAISQLFWPYDLDHGIFATIADVILGGGVLYRDTWELKGPAVYYIFALVNWMFNREESSIRIFDLLIVIIGLFYFYKILRRSVEFDRTIAVMVTSLFGSICFYSVPNSAQPDGWISIFMVIIYYHLLKDENNFRIIYAIIIGILIGIIGLLKPPYLIYSILPLAYIFTSSGQIRKKFNFIFTIALVSFTIIYAAAIYFWYKGALWDLIDNIFIYNWNFHRGGIYSIKVVIHAIINDSFYQNTFVILFISIIGFVHLLRKYRKESLLLGIWVVLTFIILYFQIRLSGSAYKNILVSTIILLYFYYSLIELKKVINYKNTLLLCFLILSFTYYQRYNDYIIPTFILYNEQISEKEYRDIVQTRKDKYVVEVADYLREINQNKEPVFVFGISSIINFLTDSPTASKYSYILPFIESSGEYFDRASYELLYELNKTPPKYFVLSGVIFDINKENTKEVDPLLRINGIKYFLEKNYTLKNVIKGYFIYVRKSE